MPARMFSRGSNALFTPSRRAVAGMSCMSPRAPFRDTARGYPFDSARMTAAMRAGSIRCCFAASRIWEEKGEEAEEEDVSKSEDAAREGEEISEKARTDRGRERLAREAVGGALGRGAGRSYSSSTMRSTTSRGIVIEPPPTSATVRRSSSTTS